MPLKTSNPAQNDTFRRRRAADGVGSEGEDAKGTSHDVGAMKGLVNLSGHDNDN